MELDETCTFCESMEFDKTCVFCEYMELDKPCIPVRLKKLQNWVIREP